MDLDTGYTFVPLAEKNYGGFHDKIAQELLTKWGVKPNICIQRFSFNEPFQPYLKYHLAELFFKDPIVASKLKTKKLNSWFNEGIIATEVKTEHIPCSVLAMSFFDRLKEPENNITYDSNKIRQTMKYNEDGDLITDNLKAMLLDPESNEYNLYDNDERKEFIFHILQMLVIGGKLCQYEDVLNPYIDVTKILYKDLVRVDRREHTTDLFISTLVLKVVAMKSGKPYFPRNIDEKTNYAFLLVDQASRQVTSFIHQLDGHEEWKKLKNRNENE
ncbi:cilia- and flagella-associated protein 300-like isoform X1 [Athalia rosae]|uniref:cilia- and flagella-associated protein 300-like isoform X1 n=1 Tax=Athalia rosae TaxID=37344 RepID=UPI002034383E|nr:cilia- and flagella-associated protein 300-like isoform X1 [Athalia rosae]